MSKAQRDIQSSNDVNLPIDWNTSEDHSSSYAPSALENLKTQYNFIQTDKISNFLRNYPFLIEDLDRIYEIKCQYFDKSPMLLHYISESESLESATLAAYVETDISEEKAKGIFSLFDKEWNVSISKEAKELLMVDII
jgi:hypothetical protein